MHLWDIHYLRYYVTQHKSKLLAWAGKNHWRLVDTAEGLVGAGRILKQMCWMAFQRKQRGSRPSAQWALSTETDRAVLIQIHKFLRQHVSVWAHLNASHILKQETTAKTHTHTHQPLGQASSWDPLWIQNNERWKAKKHKQKNKDASPLSMWGDLFSLPPLWATELISTSPVPMEQIQLLASQLFNINKRMLMLAPAEDNACCCYSS